MEDALRAVAEDDERLNASPQVEARLLAEVRAIARARRRRLNTVVLAAAAAVFLALVLPLRPPTTPDAAIADTAATEMTTAFFPLTYSIVPAADARLVRMEVPRSALHTFGVTGFEMSDNTSPTVLADVLVGDDGLARAVRFVRIGHTQEQEP